MFARAPAALEAALAIQRAMQSNGWPGANDVRLRIGLHRGRPTLTENGYVGLSVHAVARICFAGHGGQVLVSAPVNEAVREPLEGEVSLRSLGAWRFQGLSEPMELFQVDAADLIADFPQLRAATCPVARPTHAVISWGRGALPLIAARRARRDAVAARHYGQSRHHRSIR